MPSTDTLSDDVIHASFEPRFPWWGGDLQTLRNRLVYRARPLGQDARNLIFETSDGSGDQMVGTLDLPGPAPEGPLILLLHGLTGCEDSPYMHETSRYHLARNRRVLRLNLRGAGPSQATCNNYYYAGCAQDILDVLYQLDPGLTGEGIFAIGYSLGGNVLLNLLPRLTDENRFRGAATVSAPIWPKEAADRLMTPRNAIYQHSLLRDMKRESLALNPNLGSEEKAAILAARTVYEFDDTVTGPRHGFRDADDYYTQTAGLNFVAKSPVPLLMIHAEDDPWIPVRPYRELQSDCPADVRVVVTRGGGHVGFHGKGARTPLFDTLIADFIPG